MVRNSASTTPSQRYRYIYIRYCAAKKGSRCMHLQMMLSRKARWKQSGSGFRTANIWIHSWRCYCYCQCSNITLKFWSPYNSVTIVTMLHIGRTDNRGLIPSTEKRFSSFYGVQTDTEVHQVFYPYGGTQTVIAGEECLNITKRKG